MKKFNININVAKIIKKNTSSPRIQVVEFGPSFFRSSDRRVYHYYFRFDYRNKPLRSKTVIIAKFSRNRYKCNELYEYIVHHRNYGGLGGLSSTKCSRHYPPKGESFQFFGKTRNIL